MGRQRPGSARSGTTTKGFVWPLARVHDPLARTLLSIAGFGLFVLTVGLLAGAELRWELWTAGVLGVLAYNVGYPSLLHPRTRRSPGGPAMERDVPQIDAFTPSPRPQRGRAARLEAVRRECIANASHELRTPLTVLVGFLETVREFKLDPRLSRDCLDRMEEQCKRMQRIIEDLLQLSTLESAAEPPNERINVTRLLARIRTEAEVLSAGRHRIELKAEAGFDLLGAESEIASVFGNLLSNAIRYTAPGGVVRLVWRASPAGAEFAVEDTGIGIEKDHIPRLTERFYRVDRECSRHTGGTGLGLAIVKNALNRHQAGLDIESEPGKGSRFTARFPAHRVKAVTTPLESLHAAE
jgi:signal transduction histidine kinase